MTGLFSRTGLICAIVVALAGCDDDHDHYYYDQPIPPHDRLPAVAVAHDYQTALTFDADNDGDLDIFLGQRVTRDPMLAHDVLLFNNGSGRFTSSDTALPERHYSWYGSTKAACTLDYNHDGDLDIFTGVTSAQTGRVSLQLLKNDGDGSFSDQPDSLPTSWHNRNEYDTSWCGAVDLDSDGNEDVLLRLADGSMHFFRFETGSGFVDVTADVEWTGDAVSHTYMDATFGDLSGDSLADLIHFETIHAAPAGQRRFAVYTNESTPGQFAFSAHNFPADAMIEGEINKALIVDLNDDGDNDVVLAQGSDDGNARALLIFEGDGAGGLSNISATANPDDITLRLPWQGLLVRDFDNDGAVDIFSSDLGDWWQFTGANPVLLRQTSELVFDDVSATELPANARACARTAVAGDFRGTGALDIFVATQLCDTSTAMRSYLLLNDGAGRFTSER